MKTKCVWSENEDGYWETTCGNAFVLNDGGPSENKMAYCCYCGASLLEQPYPEHLADEEE